MTDHGAPDQPEEDDGEDLSFNGEVFSARFLEPLNEVLTENNRRIMATLDTAVKLSTPKIRLIPPQVTPLGQALKANLGLDKVIRALAEPITAATERMVRDLFQRTFTAIDGVDRFYPFNLVRAHLDPGQLEQLLITEGIPLMWVPRTQTVIALRDAPNPAARRRILGSRWRGIATDCESVLETVTHPALTAETDYAFQAAHALRDHHTAAAQALAVNLSDTLLRHLIPEETKLIQRKKPEKETTKFTLDQRAFRTTCTIGPLWYARAFHDHRNARPPRELNRNASVHSVSRAQYSRINAVHALMLATSMIKYVDTRS